jgi:hypothetical protein
MVLSIYNGTKNDILLTHIDSNGQVIDIDYGGHLIKPKTVNSLTYNKEIFINEVVTKKQSKTIFNLEWKGNIVLTGEIGYKKVDTGNWSKYIEVSTIYKLVGVESGCGVRHGREECYVQFNPETKISKR